MIKFNKGHMEMGAGVGATSYMPVVLVADGQANR